MNLHQMAANQVAKVNPLTPLSIQVSNGYTPGPGGRQIASYLPAVTIPGQVQSLSAGDLRQVDGLNLQGIKRAIYINGRVDGLVRQDRKGGDLITTPDGNQWLVAMVLEYWPNWCKVAVTLQQTGTP